MQGNRALNARSAIRCLVAAIPPLDVREGADIRDALAWIDSGTSLCRTAKPATPPKHLVSYFVLVDGAHVLLVGHINAGLWLPTGGHVEPDEHPWATVRREAREELGLECEPGPREPLFLTVTETVGRTAGRTDVSLWYALPADRAAPLAWEAGEFRSIAWFHKDHVSLQRCDPHLARFLRKPGQEGGAGKVQKS